MTTLAERRLAHPPERPTPEETKPFAARMERVMARLYPDGPPPTDQSWHDNRLEKL